jgi:hypothetical protein
MGLDIRIVEVDEREIRSRVSNHEIGNFRPVTTPGRLDYSHKAALTQVSHNPLNFENAVQRILREGRRNNAIFQYKKINKE